MVSEGLWIALAVIAVLVVAALVLGLVRYRRRRISLSQSDEATPVDRSGGYTASSGITFSQSTETREPVTPPPAKRLDTSGLPAVGDDATVPRDAPKRSISDVQLPEPPVAAPSEPEVPEPAAARARADRAARRQARAPARPAGQVAEHAGTQHARPARRRRPRRGVVGVGRGHPADRRSRPRRHRIGGHRAAGRDGQQQRAHRGGRPCRAARRADRRSCSPSSTARSRRCRTRTSRRCCWWSG